MRQLDLLVVGSILLSSCAGRSSLDTTTGDISATKGTPDTGSSTNTMPVATPITAGGCDTCALLTGGTIQCWGDNEFGELGNGTTTNSSVPVIVSGF